MNQLEIRTVDVVRYVTPLREGGSLPAIIEADDGFLYVMKFRGAGQGKKALVAEFIGGELARMIGLKIPEIVLINLDSRFSKTEADEEIQDLLTFSVGLNLGLHFLSGAITYDPLVMPVDSVTASKIVLLDSIISNVDRTARNTNMLEWKNELWLIDHGASLYFHHNWDQWQTHLGRTFPAIKEHVLLAFSQDLTTVKTDIISQLTDENLRSMLASIPDNLLEDESIQASPEQRRAVYLAYLQDKISRIDSLIKEVEDAR